MKLTNYTIATPRIKFGSLVIHVTLTKRQNIEDYRGRTLGEGQNKIREATKTIIQPGPSSSSISTKRGWG